MVFKVTILDLLCVHMINLMLSFSHAKGIYTFIELFLFMFSDNTIWLTEFDSYMEGGMTVICDNCPWLWTSQETRPTHMKHTKGTQFLDTTSFHGLWLTVVLFFFRSYIACSSSILLKPICLLLWRSWKYVNNTKD